MLVGIPNVGKSALVNSLHQIGRISAAGICFKIYYVLLELSFFYSLYTNVFIYLWAVEKGKLKHAIVSPHPGETKDIISLKVCVLHLLVHCMS
jgi:ribosome biogenesis GTPase A